jgi:hypothetical protein
MTTIRDPARLTAVRSALKELAEVDRKTEKFMERGRGPLGLFGASGNSYFSDGELTKRELENLKAAASRAYDRLEPSGLYTLLGAVTGFGNGGPHRIAQEAERVIQQQLDILGS